jgi:hypothetical protein
MVKNIKGDLILTKDTTFNESIKVEGNILGFFNLKVEGDIKAFDINSENIDAWNIDAWNIDALDIEAWNINSENINALNINSLNINAWNINAKDIEAWDVICEKRVKKEESAKTIARVFVTEKSKLERKEW